MLDKEKVEKLLEITKNLKLLYVEDNFDAREQMLKMLKNLFDDIDIAKDGQEGLQKSKEKDYDLIITDINMPNMTGLEMSEEILKENPEKYIIVISAYNDTEYLQSCIDLGITRYIHKPVTLDSLIDIIDKTVSSIIQKNHINNLNKQINNLLNNAKNGYLSFNKNLICNSGYSKKCLEIFEKESIEGEDISNLLFKEHQKSKELFTTGIKNILESDDMFQKDLFLSLLPNLQTINKKIISLEYKILDDDNFMLILSDITKQKHLESMIEKQKKIQDMLISVATHRDDFLELKSDFLNFLETKSKDYEELLRILHTYKGNFAQLEMLHIVDAIHKEENKLKEDSFIKDDLIYQRLYTAFLEDIKIIRANFQNDFCDNKKVLKIDPENLQDIELKLKKLAIHNTAIKDSIEEILFQLNKFRYEPLKGKLNIYQKYLNMISKKVNKPIYPLEIKGDKKILIPKTLIPFIKSLTHVFSNCLVHGIEDIETRVELGKDELGTISCSFEQLQNTLILEIKDDGKGIDVDEVVKRAIKNRLKTKEECEKLTYSQKLELIFLQNLSTLDKANLTSGQGIGMNAVYEELKKLNGNILISSEKNKGTKFEFIIPIEEKCSLNKEIIIELNDSLSEQVIKLLKENSDLHILRENYIFSLDPLKNLEHVKIDFKNKFFGSAIISLSDTILPHLKSIFMMDDFNDDEILNMKDDILLELVNIIVGLSISNFPNSYQKVDISIPKKIDFSKVSTMIKSSKDYSSCVISTSKGDIYCTVTKDKIKEKTKEEVC
jgi:two-component system chemotaxis sensor kinase CheA